MSLHHALDLPWILPGVAIALLVSLAVSGAVCRALRVRRPVAWVIVLSLGVILAATMTPQWEALAFGVQGSSSCDFSRIGLAPLGELLRFDDTSLKGVEVKYSDSNHAARPWYSWMSPPSRSRRRTSRVLTGTGTGTQASASGEARPRARWGRPRL